MSKANYFWKMMRILAMCVSVILCAYGVVSFLGLDITSPIDIILPVYYIIFSLMIFAAQIKFKKLLSKFMFLENAIGMGIFMIFVGTLCIRSSSAFAISCTVLLITCGAIHVLCFCIVREEKEPAAGSASE